MTTPSPTPKAPEPAQTNASMPVAQGTKYYVKTPWTCGEFRTEDVVVTTEGVLDDEGRPRTLTKNEVDALVGSAMHSARLVLIVEEAK